MIEEIYEDLALNEGAYDPYAFHAIFICGAPGSGKSTVERKMALEARGLKPLNADQTLLRLRNLNANITNQDYPHAGETTEKRFKMWSHNYLGLILNTTGRNLDTIQRLNRILKDNYYTTFMLFVDVDEKIALSRIEARMTAPNPETQLDPKNQEELNYFNTAFAAVKKNVQTYQNMFDENHFAIVRNDDPHTIAEDFEKARKKLNRFLISPAGPEAQAILKGVNTRAYKGNLSRRFSRI